MITGNNNISKEQSFKGTTRCALDRICNLGIVCRWRKLGRRR